MISDPTVTVTCDTPGCGYDQEFGLTATAGRGYDERNLDGALHHYGWVTLSDNVHKCPQCVEREQADGA